MSEKLPPLKLIVQNGPTPGQVFTIDNIPQTIGRGEDCDISIPDMSLSRQHVQIRVTPHGYVMEDLGSTNGSFVNESPVRGGTLLMHGDQIRLGVTFSFKVDYGFGPPPVEPAAGAVAVPPAPVPAGPAGLGPRTFGLWLMGIAAGLLIFLLLVGGLLYLRFGGRAQPPTPTLAVALPSPALPDTPTPGAETPTPGESSPTVTALPVPGLAAAAASQQTFPIGALNEVDPFCESKVEVSANSPVFMRWQQPLAETSNGTDYVRLWLEAVYYEISLNGRPLTQLNYQADASQDGSTLTWWSDLGILPPGNHYLSLRWYANRQISTGLDLEPADGQPDLFGPGLAGESFCEIAVPEVITLATPTPTSTLTPQPTPSPTLVPQVQAPPPSTPTPPPPPTATSAQVAAGPGSSGGYTLAIGGQHRYEQPWGAARDNDVCRSYRENSWDNSNLSFRGFHLELLLTNNADTPVQDGWTPTYTTAGGQGGRFCYNPYPDGRGTEVMPDGTGSVTFFALVPNEDYVNSVRLEVNGQVIQFCLNSNGDYCSGGEVASQPGSAPSGPTATPPPPAPPSVEAYVTEENDDCILYSWSVQNVKEIYFDDKGVAGVGHHLECDEDVDDDDGDVDNPTLRIVHLDGRVEDISLEPDDDNPRWRD